MPTLFQSIRDRLFRKAAKGNKIYEVEWSIYHDGNLVTRFRMNIKANSKPHAWAILSKYVEVKPTELRFIRNA